VTSPYGAGAAPAIADSDARKVVLAGELDGGPSKPTKEHTQAIRADLIGSDRCTAAGITATGNASVLALCRRLLAVGYDPATPMRVYRGAVLALSVRSIGEGAALEINGKGTSFVLRRDGTVDVGTAPLTRNSGNFDQPEGRRNWPPATHGRRP
jgi:hypothetical protein